MRLELVIVLAAFGCASKAGPAMEPDGGPSGGTCPLYQTTANLTSPTASFRNDVVPVFRANCSSGVCHGSARAPYLGSDAEQVLAGLVGHDSQTLPTMALVTPGSPEDSFLMHKMDADQCAYSATCASNNCGSQMPRDSNMPLAPQLRDNVRRWIAQGAQDN